jgi:hypothetical protein
MVNRGSDGMAVKVTAASGPLPEMIDVWARARGRSSASSLEPGSWVMASSSDLSKTLERCRWECAESYLVLAGYGATEKSEA